MFARMDKSARGEDRLWNGEDTSDLLSEDAMTIGGAESSIESPRIAFGADVALHRPNFTSGLDRKSSVAWMDSSGTQVPHGADTIRTSINMAGESKGAKSAPAVPAFEWNRALFSDDSPHELVAVRRPEVSSTSTCALPTSDARDPSDSEVCASYQSHNHTGTDCGDLQSGDASSQGVRALREPTKHGDGDESSSDGDILRERTIGATITGGKYTHTQAEAVKSRECSNLAEHSAE